MHYLTEALVIEDDPDARRLVSGCLRGMGLHVVEAASAGEGAALLEQMTPDVVCLDLRLPDENGLALCERMRASARLRDIPVVAVTALSRPVDRARAEVAGVDDYVTKPFRASALTASVRELIALSAVAAS